METEVVYRKVDGLELAVSFPKNASERVRNAFELDLPKILNDKVLRGELLRHGTATELTITLSCDPTGERTIFYGVQYLLNGQNLGERHDIMPHYLK